MTSSHDVAARDFVSRHRSGTGPRSPIIAPESPQLQRVGSANSRLSVETTGTLRHRKPSRSNTVTTYHEAPVGESYEPGAEPGVDTNAEDDPEHLTRLKANCEINIIDFSDAAVEHVRADNENLEEALRKPRVEELPCRWISVNGLSWDVIKQLGRKYHLHRLSVEDLIHTKTRTKVDWYANHACIILTLQKLVRLHQHNGRNDKECHCNNDSDSDQIDEKLDLKSHRKPKSKLSYFTGRKQPDVLPRYLDSDGDGKIDQYVNAHSGTSEETPIKPIRTLHRYESAMIPEHTAFMEKHSALSQENFAVSVEQVTIFLLADNCVISFFEHSAEDVERPILKRLNSQETVLRRSNDASLLTQAIIDAIVDLALPVKDAYNKARKELQIDAMTKPDIQTSRSLHIFGEEIDMLQNLFKPIVQLVNSLRDHHMETQPSYPPLTPPLDPATPGGSQVIPSTKMIPKTKRDREGAPVATRQFSDFRRIAMKRTGPTSNVVITPLAHTYFGDVLDHCITMIAALEQMDASANNISTLIFNTVGAKTNNFTMILAVVTVFFAPLTFTSGYFGMNFAGGSGLKHPFGFFWVVALPALVAFMLIVFAAMLRDNIRDFLIRRGIKARWPGSHRRRG